jgi:hypothetical protein
VQTLAANRGRVPLSLPLFVGGFAAIAAAGVLAPQALDKTGPVLFVLMVAAVAHRWLLRWQNLVALVVLVILLIPMRRYTLPSSLPFQLEPYRVVVAFVALGWLTSLLIDRKVRIRRTGLEFPLGVFAFAMVASMGMNPHRVSAVSSVLVKTLMFWGTYFLVVYLLPSVLRRVDVELVCKALVGGGAFVSIAAIIESRTHYNAFDHLTTVMPFLHLGELPFQSHDLTGAARGGRPRAYASAQHPIALGAAVVMLLPLAIYLAKKTAQRRWFIAALLLLLALFATVSRTGFLMLIVVLAIIYWLRHQEVKRYWPAIIPAVALIHVAVPGTVGTMIDAFFPKGGLIAQQTNANVGSGRLATLKPVLRTEFYPNPLLGEGFATRVSGDNGPAVKANAPILDDEWAGVLVETGVIGALALGWLMVRAVRMLGGIARKEPGPDGWLATALAAGIASFGIGMFTFDAFSFIQVTFLFFLFLGLTGVLNEAQSSGRSTAPVRLRMRQLGLKPR